MLTRFYEPVNRNATGAKKAPKRKGCELLRSPSLEVKSCLIALPAATKGPVRRWATLSHLGRRLAGNVRYAYENTVVPVLLYQAKIKSQKGRGAP